MPAVPKKKMSKGRQGKRAAHYGLRAQSLSECSQCHSVKQPHRVCPSCGYYNGREVVAQETDAGPA
jgi:large subunit ribosomal protein L32